MLLDVISRELETLAGAEHEYAGPLQMIAALLRTLDHGGNSIAPPVERTMDPQALRTYLSDHGLIDRGDELSILRSALGFSKDTYLITVSGRHASRTLAVRRDLPAGPTRTTVVDEFPLLRDLYRLGLPVAEPLLVEANPTPGLGGPFMISAGVKGEPQFFTSQTQPAVRKRGARDLASFLARLHTAPVESLNVLRQAPGAAPREELTAYVGWWRRLWEECAPARHQHVVAQAFQHLESSLPPLRRFTLVHADVGFHNILVHEDRIQAVLDWEFAHLGEPEEDLAYARPSIEALVPFDEFLRMYQEAGAPEPSPERLAAYRPWRGLRNAACCALGRRSFESGLNSDLRLAYAGRIILEASVADALAQLE